jgi:ABC-type sugar transport system permease subunit
VPDAEIDFVSATSAEPILDRTTSQQSRSTYLWILLFLLPFLVLYLGFTLWPLVATAAYSTFDWDGIGALSRFVGLGNYLTIAADPIFWRSLSNTLIFALLNTAIKLPATLFLAILLTRRWLWMKRFFRTIFFLPVIIPVSVAGLVFTYLLNPSNGALSAFLRASGLVHQPVDLLGHDGTAILVLALISVWQIFGQYLVYWMAALQMVPADLYDAAEIDGCGEWAKLIRMTLPLILPIAVIIAMLAFINALYVFGLVVTLTSGGPGHATYVMSYFIYVEAFSQIPFRYGYASAAALLYGLLALVFIVSQAHLVRRTSENRRTYAE